MILYCVLSKCMPYVCLRESERVRREKYLEIEYLQRARLIVLKNVCYKLTSGRVDSALAPAQYTISVLLSLCCVAVTFNLTAY